MYIVYLTGGLRELGPYLHLRECSFRIAQNTAVSSCALVERPFTLGADILKRKGERRLTKIFKIGFLHLKIFLMMPREICQ